MAPRTPFTVIPWQEDFLKGLLELVLEDTGGNVSNAIFIFPHSRPRRYLSLLLFRDPRVSRPLIMPQTHTVSGLFATLSGRILSRPAWNAGLLDRVGLLLSCVREEAGGNPAGNTPFLTDARLFFPWGVRLASLFEECFSQHRKPHDFLHVEEQVSPFADMILSHLGGIYTRYESTLQEREWTSPGFDASLAADYLQKNGELPEGVLPGNKPLYIAGFHALTGTEHVLFRHLWERMGAKIVIHADPALVGERDSRPHWSCSAFHDWATAWHAGLVLAPGYFPEKQAPEMPRRIRYIQGFDLHSQLSGMEKELADMASPEAQQDATPGEPPDMGPNVSPPAEDPAKDHAADTVVVLPDSSLLMPVLHHLPRTDINVSMGYPLSRSPLFRLVDTLARLQEGKKSTGYYWRDLVELLRHPYLKMLSPATETAADDQEKNPPPLLLRGELHRLERELRDRGRRFADPRSLLFDCYQALTPEELPPAPVLQLLDDLFLSLFAAFENLSSLKGLAAALKGLCSLLLEHGTDLWRRFPIDAECLYRLHHSLIPALELSELSNEPFLPETLFVVLRSLMAAERVPFEADPLVGLQVMGMLETRLLSFRRVLILSAEESFLPGSPAGDPLLPEALRPELGLPPLQTREQVSAYTFFRLLAGAEEVLLLWQEGGEGSGIQEQKPRRSRFVEELLWREEKRRKRLLSSRGTDGPLTVVATSIAPISRVQPGIPVTPAMRRLLDELLNRPVSASLLDAYLRCPVRFYYERAAHLSQPEEVREGDDPLAVGELFHQVLQDGYGMRLNQALPGGEELARSAGEDLLAALRASPGYRELAGSLPADAFTMLSCAGKKRLTDYLLHQPPTTVLATETPLQAEFSFHPLACTLTGKLDRIDKRFQTDASEAGIVVLDYKTGRLPSVAPSLWEDESLWRALQSWRPECDASDPLQSLASYMESVQLPFYLLLYSLAARQGRLPQELRAHATLPVLDAAWINLGSAGEEVSLFQKIPEEDRHRILEGRIPLLVDFLLRHIRENLTLQPRFGPHCDWCSCEKLCKVFAASG